MWRLSALIAILGLLFGTHLLLDRRAFLGEITASTRLGATILGDWTARTFDFTSSLMAAAGELTEARQSHDDAETIGTAFHRLLGVNPAVVDLGLYTAEGRLLGSAQRGGRLPEQLREPAWRAPLTLPGIGPATVGAVQEDRRGRPLIIAAYQLRTGELLVGAIDPDYMVAAFRTVLRRPASVVTLLDSKGQIMARTRKDRFIIGGTLPMTVTAADAEIEGVANADPRLAGEAPIARLGLDLTLTTSKQDIAAEWWRRQTLFIAMFAAALSVLIVGGHAFYKRLLDIERNRIDLRQARDRAQDASEAKSRFLAMMSHELRTPMTGVIGTLDLLRQSALTGRQAQLVKVLATSANALLEVLNDILDFSKIEAGAVQIEAVDFRLEDVLENTTDMFEARCQQKNIRLTTVIERDVPTWLTGDPTRIRQVLTNLVGNAVKFTEGGEIGLRVCLRTLGEMPTGGPIHLLFSVQDSGVGISSATQSHLFEPFVQADASTARRYGGTGLGLAICRRLVQAMGGEIGLTSAIGNGSRFWFTVRLDRAPGQPRAASAVASPAPASATPHNGARVLVAEDNEINRFLIREQLTRRGYRVTTVENGWQAVEEQRNNPHDLVILDMRMPVMDGPTALAHIRALDGVAATCPVVALTADALAEEIEIYIRSGVDALHTKPIDWLALDETLSRLLDQSGTMIAARGSRKGTAPAAVPVSLRGLNRADPGFDRAMIDELADVMDGQAIRELVASFRVTLVKEGAILRDAALAGDAARLREAAHTIQGMAAQMGANGIATVARTIRLDGPSPISPEDLPARLDLYDTIVDATLNRIDVFTSLGAA
ncbi:ATP-binding protein [Zavarzinia sp.]|uniref:hybrid sensor histidine kinase/response regulator n=1 Tax=Zavarzinia sp. TaxID=2027920 RepID=UPI003BB7187D